MGIERGRWDHVELPSNLEAERSVLGAVLVDEKYLDELVADGLKVSDFHQRQHQHVFAAMLACEEDGTPIDVLTVAEKMKEQGTLRSDENEGTYFGPAEVSQLMDGIPKIINAAFYGAVVRRKAREREFIILGNRMLHADDGEFESRLEEAESALDRIRQAMEETDRGGLKKAQEGASEAMDLIEKMQATPGRISGTPTGFHELDRATAGMEPGEYWLLAGRPGHGKTACAMFIAENVARQGKPVAFFSLEMLANQLMLRSLCSHARVDSVVARRGELGSKAFDDLVEAMRDWMKLPVYIDDESGLTPNAMRARSRRFQREHDGELGLIVVDYLQIVGTPARASREQEVRAISEGLKNMAKDLKVPVIGLSQLGRECEKTGRRPQTTDLRESGSLEQDANAVLFAWRPYVIMSRPDAKEKADPAELARWEKVVELILDKHRNADRTVLTVGFDQKHTRFYNLAHGQAPPDA